MYVTVRARSCKSKTMKISGTSGFRTPKLQFKWPLIVWSPNDQYYIHHGKSTELLHLEIYIASQTSFSALSHLCHLRQR